MDRLTSCDMYFNDVDKRLFYAKLKQYEDAEESGFLIKLPCRVGDTVWLTNHDRLVLKEKPMMCNVDEFKIQYNNCYAILNAIEPFYSLHRFKSVNIKEFGKTVFLTKEEAERASIDKKGI